MMWYWLAHAVAGWHNNLPLGPYFRTKGHQRSNLWATCSKFGGKMLPNYYVTAWIEEVFMPNAIVPYNELLRDVHTSLLKDSKRVVCI